MRAALVLLFLCSAALGAELPLRADPSSQQWQMFIQNKGDLAPFGKPFTGSWADVAKRMAECEKVNRKPCQADAIRGH